MAFSAHVWSQACSWLRCNVERGVGRDVLWQQRRPALVACDHPLPHHQVAACGLWVGRDTRPICGQAVLQRPLKASLNQVWRADMHTGRVRGAPVRPSNELSRSKHGSARCPLTLTCVWPTTDLAHHRPGPPPTWPTTDLAHHQPGPPKTRTGRPVLALTHTHCDWKLALREPKAHPMWRDAGAQRVGQPVCVHDLFRPRHASDAPHAALHARRVSGAHHAPVAGAAVDRAAVVHHDARVDGAVTKLRYLAVRTVLVGVLPPEAHAHDAVVPRAGHKHGIVATLGDLHVGKAGACYDARPLPMAQI
eukprot:365193-Chlamydomonas_euryale.AAC.15